MNMALCRVTYIPVHTYNMPSRRCFQKAIVFFLVLAWRQAPHLELAPSNGMNANDAAVHFIQLDGTDSGYWHKWGKASATGQAHKLRMHARQLKTFFFSRFAFFFLLKSERVFVTYLHSSQQVSPFVKRKVGTFVSAESILRWWRMTVRGGPLCTTQIVFQFQG